MNRNHRPARPAAFGLGALGIRRTEVITYNDYVAQVLGGKGVDQIVAEFGLDGSTRRDLDEWLGHCEIAAFGATMPSGIAKHHETALNALHAEAQSYGSPVCDHEAEIEEARWNEERLAC